MVQDIEAFNVKFIDLNGQLFTSYKAVEMYIFKDKYASEWTAVLFVNGKRCTDYPSLGKTTQQFCRSAVQIFKAALLANYQSDFSYHP